MFAWTVWAAWACHLGWLQMDQIVGLRETWVVFKSLTPSRTWFLPTPIPLTRATPILYGNQG